MREPQFGVEGVDETSVSAYDADRRIVRGATMKVELEAWWDGDEVHLSVAGANEVAVTLPCGYDPYRASEEMAVTSTVSDWLRTLGGLEARIARLESSDVDHTA
jgi:hypothetical protein